MTRTPRLTSDTAACCWIPLFALRCETARRPELASLPLALLAPDDTRRLWQVAPLARRAGVKPGMTVSQAIGLCPALKLCEPDPVHYDEQFARLVAALVTVSPVVEPVELGRAYVGTDGLERLYGSPQQIVKEIQMRSAECGMRNLPNAECGMGNAECKGRRREANDPSLKFRNPHSAFRIGWGRGKFVAWVAATRAKPGEAVPVPVGGEAQFLASQRLAVLPLDPDTHRRLFQLRVKTLGALVALPEEAVVSPVGPARRRPGRLAASGRRRLEPWSDSSSSSPPSPRAPRSCSCSRAMRAPRLAPGDDVRSRAPRGRSRSGSEGRCCITSSRCNHGPASPSVATR